MKRGIRRAAGRFRSMRRCTMTLVRPRGAAREVTWSGRPSGRLSHWRSSWPPPPRPRRRRRHRRRPPKPPPRRRATVAGTPIDLDEVDELIRPQLMEFRAKEHQLRSQALDALIGRTLIEKEAAARGMTAEALDHAEVAGQGLRDRRRGEDALRDPQGALPERGRGGGARADPRLGASAARDRAQERLHARAARPLRRARAARAVPRPGGAGPGARARQPEGER